MRRLMGMRHATLNLMGRVHVTLRVIRRIRHCEDARGAVPLVQPRLNVDGLQALPQPHWEAVSDISC